MCKAFTVIFVTIWMLYVWPIKKWPLKGVMDLKNVIIVKPYNTKKSWSWMYQIKFYLSEKTKPDFVSTCDLLEIYKCALCNYFIFEGDKRPKHVTLNVNHIVLFWDKEKSNKRIISSSATTKNKRWTKYGSLQDTSIVRPMASGK